MDDSTDNLNPDSLTLEQAKQELLHLRRFKKATLDFLFALCGYEIREHAKHLSILHQIILHRTRKFQSIEPDLDVNEFIELAEFIREDIFTVADTIAGLTQDERFPHRPNYTLQKTTLDQILNTCVVHAREKIDYDNRNRDKLRNDKQVILMQAPDPIEFAAEIPNNLPPINANEYLIERTLINLTWLMTRHHLKTKFEFDAHFDDSLVSITMRCWSFHTHDVALTEYEQFESNSTFMGLSMPSLCLFNCWKAVKICGGQMKFDIEKSNARGKEPDRTIVAVELPRYHE